jgi:protein TonB
MKHTLFAAVAVLFVSSAAAAQEPVASDELRTTADTVRPDEPDPEKFIPAAIEPTYDHAEFQSRLLYPEDARRYGIQGTVVLRILVSKDGKALRCRVESTESKILLDAAVAATMATRFTPGTQEGRPIHMWVTVPVTFTLDE